MPLFDGMYYDQKWSLWDTFPSAIRNIRGYVITSSRHIANLVTATKRRGQTATTTKRRGEVKTAGG